MDQARYDKTLAEIEQAKAYCAENGIVMTKDEAYAAMRASGLELRSLIDRLAKGEDVLIALSKNDAERKDFSNAALSYSRPKPVDE